MRRLNKTQIILTCATLVWVVFVVLCVWAVIGFFSNPERPIIGDPEPQSKNAILHNKATVPLLVSDAGRYAPRFRQLRLLPGETREVEVGYRPSYRDERKNSLCLSAETEDLQQTFYQCLTIGELEGANWKWEIQTDSIQRR